MITQDKKILIAKDDRKEVYLLSNMANRHGLITGATGTGKTVTLQTMAESFSQIGVPVFLSDVKGDLSGIAAESSPNGKIAERIEKLQLRELGYESRAFPVAFFDVYGEKGHPLRTTISSMGPLLLSRILNLNEVQSGLMHIVFRVADDNGLLLLDLKDLKALLKHVSDEKAKYQEQYGNISSASIGAIQRGLLRLEDEGGDLFFGEPELNIEDLMQSDENGYGQINILESQKLISNPKIYSTVLLWLLSELYEKLPERGDKEKPLMVFFFDEAHLLFNDVESSLLQKICQVVRLIRSKGVGVYFISQNPADIPDEVLGQLGNKIQHALRAYTPKDQKALKAAADSFRTNPEFSTEKAIGELAVGEALISFLDEKGSPQMVERSFIVPPQSQVGPVDDAKRKNLIKTSLLAGIYDTAVDRESAYEILTQKALADKEEAQRAIEEKERQKQLVLEERQRIQEERLRMAQERHQAAMQRQSERAARSNPTVVDQIIRTTGRTITSSIGRSIGRTIVRGVLGSIFGSK